MPLPLQTHLSIYKEMARCQEAATGRSMMSFESRWSEMRIANLQRLMMKKDHPSDHLLECRVADRGMPDNDMKLG